MFVETTVKGWIPSNKYSRFKSLETQNSWPEASPVINFWGGCTTIVPVITPPLSESTGQTSPVAIYLYLNIVVVVELEFMSPDIVIVDEPNGRSVSIPSGLYGSHSSIYPFAEPVSNKVIDSTFEPKQISWFKVGDALEALIIFNGFNLNWVIVVTLSHVELFEDEIESVYVDKVVTVTEGTPLIWSLPLTGIWFTNLILELS